MEIQKKLQNLAVREDGWLKDKLELKNATSLK